MHPEWCEVTSCRDDPTLHVSLAVSVSTIERPIRVCLVQPSADFSFTRHEVMVRMDDYLLTMAQADILAQVLTQYARLCQRVEISAKSPLFSEEVSFEETVLETADEVTQVVAIIPAEPSWALTYSYLVRIDDLLLAPEEALTLADTLGQMLRT